MMRKSILISMLAISFISCDDDFRQGSCEEGFYQQNDGNGGYFCAPIFEDGVVDKPITDSGLQNETN